MDNHQLSFRGLEGVSSSSSSRQVPSRPTTDSPWSPCSRADLHVHTSHSPVHDGALGRFRLVESYTSPRAAYDLAMARGMDFVAITDHDTITGALELAHDPRVIVGCEISARFPHDRTKIHVVALGLNEVSHREAQELRDNVYELLQYLCLQNVFHFVAHPFYRMGRLGLGHFEQLLLLFKAFETRNGGKQVSPSSLLDRTLDSLTPSVLMDLANKHDMAPFGAYPWRKTKVGGSDDHAGIAIGTTFTVTPPAADAAEFVRHLSEGRSFPGGAEGSVTSVASQCLAFASALVDARSRGRRRTSTLRNLTGHPQRRASLAVLSSLPRGLVAKVRDALGRCSPLERALTQAFLGDREIRHLALVGTDPSPDAETDVFPLLSRLADEVTPRLRMSRNPIYRGLSWVIPLLPALPLLAAVVAEFRQRPLMRTIRRRHLRSYPPVHGLVCGDLHSSRVMASRSVRAFLEPELRQRTPLDMLTADILEESQLLRGLRGRDSTLLVEWVRRAAEKGYDRIYCVTTGPLGALGIAMGALLEIPVSLRFGRSEQRLVRRLWSDRTSHAAWRAAVRWVLAMVDEIRVASEAAERAARLAGASSAQIRRMTPVRGAATREHEGRLTSPNDHL